MHENTLKRILRLVVPSTRDARIALLVNNDSETMYPIEVSDQLRVTLVNYAALLVAATLSSSISRCFSSGGP